MGWKKGGRKPADSFRRLGGVGQVPVKERSERKPAHCFRRPRLAASVRRVVDSERTACPHRIGPRQWRRLTGGSQRERHSGGSSNGAGEEGPHCCGPPISLSPHPKPTQALCTLQKPTSMSSRRRHGGSGAGFAAPTHPRPGLSPLLDPWPTPW